MIGQSRISPAFHPRLLPPTMPISGLRQAVASIGETASPRRQVFSRNRPPLTAARISALGQVRKNALQQISPRAPFRRLTKAS
jgi:hypothetical protein